MTDVIKVDHLYTAQEIMNILKVSKSTLRKLRQDENFPKPKIVSERLLRWTSSEIKAYQESLVAEEV